MPLEPTFGLREAKIMVYSRILKVKENLLRIWSQFQLKAAFAFHAWKSKYWCEILTQIMPDRRSMLWLRRLPYRNQSKLDKDGKIPECTVSPPWLKEAAQLLFCLALGGGFLHGANGRVLLCLHSRISQLRPFGDNPVRLHSSTSSSSAALAQTADSGTIPSFPADPLHSHLVLLINIQSVKGPNYTPVAEPWGGH